MVSDEQAITLVRENERYKTALWAIRTLAERALFGAWRQQVYDLANNALERK